MRPFFLAFSLFLGGCAVHKTELEDTLEWMDNTYNAHEKVSAAYGHGRSAWYTPDKSSPVGETMAYGVKENFSYKDCDMTLLTEEVPESEKSQRVLTSCTIRFNLRDIDPSSIKTTAHAHRGDFSCEPDDDGQKSIMAENCDHAEMSFGSRNAAGLIQEDWITVYPNLPGADHENRRSGKSNKSYFEFDDPEYAKRFAKAFRRAVELCGGRASTF